MNSTGILAPLINELKDTMLSTLLSTFKELLPVFLLYISVVVIFKFVKRLFTPKYDGVIFDDNYFDDFDLAYDSLRRYYDSDNDFINDYMSDFTAFQDDEPEPDELVEYDMWDNYTHDRYVDLETAFVEDFESDFSVHYEDFEGSYSDYVEHSETE